MSLDMDAGRGCVHASFIVAADFLNCHEPSWICIHRFRHIVNTDDVP
jgi:hypothetical protein